MPGAARSDPVRVFRTVGAQEHRIGRMDLMVVLPLHAALMLAVGTSAPTPAVDAYERELAKVRRQAPGSIEPLFGFAVAAGKEVETLLARASEAAAAGRSRPVVPTEVEGLFISSEEALFAKPDARFFLALAKRNGDAQDRKFFELLTATVSEYQWPVYLQQQTDVTGCMQFDTPALPTLYKRWLSVARGEARAYKQRAVEEVESIEQWLLDDCACGDKKSVIEGLGAVLRSSPPRAFAEKVRARLESVKRGGAEVRYHCASG